MPLSILRPATSARALFGIANASDHEICGKRAAAFALDNSLAFVVLDFSNSDATDYLNSSLDVAIGDQRCDLFWNPTRENPGACRRRAVSLVFARAGTA